MRSAWFVCFSYRYVPEFFALKPKMTLIDDYRWRQLRLHPALQRAQSSVSFHEQISDSLSTAKHLRQLDVRRVLHRYRCRGAYAHLVSLATGRCEGGDELRELTDQLGLLVWGIVAVVLFTFLIDPDV
jgi:hypothetical protein